MRPEDFDYDLPPALIAQHPPATRTAARMLVMDPHDSDRFSDLGIQDLPNVIEQALIVTNDSAVIPARIFARDEYARQFELLLCNPRTLAEGQICEAWVRGGKRLKPGHILQIENCQLQFIERNPVDTRRFRFLLKIGDLQQELHNTGQIPLPPYIARPEGEKPEDRARYQTVFARDHGSIAAPTAGLHFDQDLLAQLDWVSITLHVGPGTFLPLEAEDVRQHRVGAEAFSISEATATAIMRAKAENRPVLAVGTTVTRALESVAHTYDGEIRACNSQTELVITPGFQFRVVDRLLTNFHLPKSSLLMLVSSFAGHTRTLNAYHHAVAQRYRFYSYGDCMLCSPPPR